MIPAVVAVSLSGQHTFSKYNQASINLIAGLGVEGDAHSGKTVQHLYLERKDPTRINIRQVHLIHSELLDEVNAKGFSVNPGDLGENITTRGVDLLALPTATILKIGEKVVIELTALRNPCHQIDEFQNGLLKEVLLKDDEGKLVRKTGVMGMILVGGEVKPGDPISVELPPGPHHALEYVW